MSIFSEAITRAISDYRQLLRKYLSQSERVIKLAELHLKDSSIYKSDFTLYETAQAIVKDVESNLRVPNQGYYSYSGISQFCQYLKEYLHHYEVDARTGSVAHKAQKASRALIQAIQLIALPESEKVAKKLQECNYKIAEFGSPEQHELHRCNLEQHCKDSEYFYVPLLRNFEQQLQSLQEAA